MYKERIYKGTEIELNNYNTFVVLEGSCGSNALFYGVEMEPCLMNDFLQQYGDDIDVVDDYLVGFIYIPRVLTKEEIQNEMHDYDGMNHRIIYDNKYDSIPNGNIFKDWKEVVFWTFDNDGDRKVKFVNYDDAKNWLITNKQFKGSIEVKGYKTIRLSYDRIFLNEAV